MNERIRELIEQATETVDVSAKLGIPGTERVFNKEKFAELIIRECIKSIRSTSAESIDLGRTLEESASWIENDIKRHFGVEE